jgi:predicted metal-binding membrane protein
MRMSGEPWPGAAVSFLGMWVAMTAAMMLPSLAPALWRYRRTVPSAGGARLALLIALAGLGYFVVWAASGVVALPLGTLLARATPVAVGAVVSIAGACQLTAWKARRLACCRHAPPLGRALPADAGTAWRHGVRLGLDCVRCCANLMAISLAVGIMDLRTMAAVGAAITVERLAPAGERAARAVGAVVVGAGLLLIARAVQGA